MKMHQFRMCGMFAPFCGIESPDIRLYIAHSKPKHSTGVAERAIDPLHVPHTATRNCQPGEIPQDTLPTQELRSAGQSCAYAA